MSVPTSSLSRQLVTTAIDIESGGSEVAAARDEGEERGAGVGRGAAPPRAVEGPGRGWEAEGAAWSRRGAAGLVSCR
jgi:hypothetical protein